MNNELLSILAQIGNTCNAYACIQISSNGITRSDLKPDKPLGTAMPPTKGPL